MFYSDLVSLSSEAAGVTRLVSLVSQRREGGGMGGMGAGRATAVSTRQQQQQHSLGLLTTLHW